MLNVIELEKEWKRYNFKRKVPYIVGGTLFAVCTIAVSIYILHSSTLKSISSVKKIDTPTVVKFEEKKASKVSNAHKELESVESIQSETFIIKPSMNFTKDSINQKPLPLFVPGAPLHNKEKTQSHDIQLKPKIPAATHATQQESKTQEQESKSSQPALSPLLKEEVVKKEVKKESLPKKTSQFHVTMKDEQKSLQEVINRFKHNRNPKLSLYIAKRYYAMGNYNKSYNYALITNQIDETIEDSWIIFAKSLYKLGEKKMAMKTLYSYIKNSESIKANILLNDMKRGSFR